jgi:hypothetical protein
MKDFPAREKLDLTEKVARYLVIAGTLDKNSAQDDYDLANELSLELAMVLPVPVAQGPDPSLEFIDLSDYEGFFTDLDRCFPPPPLTRSSVTVAQELSDPEWLPVVRVGSFEASFVPSLKDLDPISRRCTCTTVGCTIKRSSITRCTCSGPRPSLFGRQRPPFRAT